jgi:hypothetical protein
LIGCNVRDDDCEGWVNTKEKCVENKLAVSEGVLLCIPWSVTYVGIDGEERFFLMKLQKYRGLRNREESVRDKVTEALFGNKFEFSAKK